MLFLYTIIINSNYLEEGSFRHGKRKQILRYFFFNQTHFHRENFSTFSENFQLHEAPITDIESITFSFGLRSRATAPPGGATELT